MQYYQAQSLPHCLMNSLSMIFRARSLGSRSLPIQSLARVTNSTTSFLSELRMRVSKPLSMTHASRFSHHPLQPLCSTRLVSSSSSFPSFFKSTACYVPLRRDNRRSIASLSAVPKCSRKGSICAAAAAAAADANHRPNNTSVRYGNLHKNAILRLALTALGAAVLSGSLLASPVLADAGPSRLQKSDYPSASLAFTAAPPEAAKDASVLHESKAPLPSDLSPDELAVVRLFQQNTPAVVNVSNIAAARTPYSMDLMKIPLGQGSGFVWDTRGHIITNAHVVKGAYEVRVALIDQSVYKAKLIGKDDAKDIAVLQLDAPDDILKQLRPIKLGSSSSLFVGQKVLAIGNPFGLDHTLTSGIISGLNRELANPSGVGLRNVIQTDAAINPGNSGGPLLDSKGRLIGINTAIASPSGAFNGVGFAIPVDSVKGLVEQILTYGRVVRPVMGITIAPPQALRQLNLEGVLVLNAPSGSPAAKAGMVGISRDGFGRVVIGDVIVGFNGQKVRSEGDLFDALDRSKVGDTVKVDVLRRGSERRTLTVTLGDRPLESIE